METQSVIIEPGTFRAEDLSAELFHQLPTDNR